MPKTRTRSAVRRVATLTGLWMIAVSAGAAHGELEATLQRCAQAPSADARIRCLEAALAVAHGADEKTAEAVTPAPPATAPAPPAPVADADRSLGAEQVAARERGRAHTPPARLRAQIADHRIVGYQTLQVELDNGQIWRQLAADTQRLRLPQNDTLTAEIWQTRYGAYQMRIEELRRTIRVERVR